MRNNDLLLKIIACDILLDELNNLKEVKNKKCGSFPDMMKLQYLENQIEHFEEEKEMLLSELSLDFDTTKKLLKYVSRFSIKRDDKGCYFSLNSNISTRYKFLTANEMIEELYKMNT